MARPGLPLRTLLLGLVGIPLAALVGVLAFDSYRQFASEVEDATRVTRRIAERVAVQTSTFLASSEKALAELARRPLVQALDRGACDPMLADLRRLQPSYANALTLDARGRLVCSGVTPPATAAAGPDPKYYFDEVVRTRRFTVGKPALGFATGRWVSTLAYPVLDGAGELRGVVGLAVDLANYQPVVATPKPPAGTLVGILNGEGTLIALSEGGEERIGRAQQSAAASEIVKRRSGSARLTGSGGTDRYYGFAPIPGSDWIAIAGTDAAIVLGPAKRAALERLLLLAVTLSGLLVLVLLVKRRIEQPLEAMAAAVRGVREGDLARRIAPVGAREVVDIATEFNAMLDARARQDAELRESERRHRDMLDNVDLASVMLDREGRITYANDFFLRRTGWTREELLGSDWFATFVADDRDRRRERYLRDIAGAVAPRHIDTDIVARDGRRLRFHLNLMLLRAPGGEVIGNAAIGEDITDRERAFAVLRQREERYRALAEQSPDAILIHQDLRIVFANRAFVELLRARDAAELIGRPATAVLRPEYAPAATERIAALYAGKSLPRAEQVYVRLDGTEVPVEIAAAPILFEGRPAAQVTVRDITERARERSLVTGQAGIMERIAAGAPLPETLQAVVDFIEADAPDMLASIMLLDEDRVHVRHGAAGRLPAAYWQAIDGEPIGPKAGSCGTAMYRGEQVVVPDIATDPLWEDYRSLAAAHGLRACWSTPIVDAQQRVLGSFALYFHQPGRPNERDQQLIRMATHTAAIAILKSRSEGELARSEAMFRSTFEDAAIGMTMTDPRGRLIRCNPAFCRMLGFSEAELAGRPFAELTHPDDVEENRRLYAALMAGDIRHFQMEKRYLRKDGQIVWVQINVSQVAAGEGVAPFTIGMMEDITARRRAEEERNATNLRNRALVQALGEIVYEWWPQKNLLVWDGEFTRVLGYSREEIGGDTASWTERVHPEDLVHVKAELEQVVRERRNYQLEYRFRHRDGGWRWMLDSGVPHFTAQGDLERIVGVFSDITGRRRAQQALQDSEGRYRGILESMTDGFIALDREWRIIYVNPRAAVITARAAESLAGRDLFDAFPEVAGTPFETDYRRAMAERVPVQGEHFFEPWERWFEVRAEPTPDGLSIFFRDTTEKRKSESRIEYLATHDELTGLPNRNLMQDRVTQALAHARRGEREVAMLHVDLDRFKVINDAYGHAFGDAVLKESGARLAALVREGDTVARPGGDGFLVLLADLRQSSDAYVVAQKVVDAFARPFGLDAREVFVSASVGVSTFPQDGQTADALISNAEVAMYRAKELGRNTYQFFTRDMSEQTHRRVEIETALRTAVARNELHLAYQPKVDLASGRISGCEALLRWTHPALGMVSPARFIPVAEDSGLIVPIGDWVLRTACAQARAWQAAGLPPLTVSVNLSARQFLQQDVVAWVSQVLADTGMPPERLELELTESMIAQDAEKAIATVQRLKQLGLRLAIDDFGTGYSNLSQLKRFRVDALKIDQSFVRALDSDVDDATIVLAVITLAHNLRMSAVAEGVETEAQWRFLRLNRCDAMQGYYFSKPVPAAEFQAMLAEGRKLHNTVRP